jgi:heat-inducible transcriptional repressor
MKIRSQQILDSIVTEYIKTAQPVGSQFIAQKGTVQLSPATIRNEMAELEKAGYITQPHTSAGRVPTEKGYQHFVDHSVSFSEPGSREQAVLQEVMEALLPPYVDGIKQLAKQLAELSAEAVFIGLGPNSSYYTGLSNLFRQPEFAEQQLVYQLTKIIDHLDGVLTELVADTSGDLEVLIGSRNPFGRDCSTIVARYQSPNAQGVIGILGPMRMDYQRNINLISYSQRFINR